MNNGRLLVSSKDGKSYGGVIALLVLTAFLVVFAILLLSTAGEYRDNYWEKDKATLLSVCGILMLFAALFSAVTTIMAQTSFCDVYENAIVGKTTFEAGFFKNKQAQKVEIPMDRVDTVAVERNCVVVSSCGQKYKFVGGKKKDEIANAIRARAVR